MKNHLVGVARLLSGQIESRYPVGMLSHCPSCLLRPTAWLSVLACLLTVGTWQTPSGAQDTLQQDAPNMAQACEQANLKTLEGEVADLARLVGQELLLLDANMSDLATKPSLLFERSQTFWLKSRATACAAEGEDQAATCLCETGLARHADLTKLHQTLQTAVATAQESER